MAKMLKVPERKLVPMSSSATSQIGRASLVEELQRIPGAPDPVLLETLPKGVAFHHAGLPFAVCLSAVLLETLPKGVAFHHAGLPSAAGPSSCIWPALVSPERARVCFLTLHYCCLSGRHYTCRESVQQDGQQPGVRGVAC